MAKIIDSAGGSTPSRQDMDERLPNNAMLIWGTGNPEGSISALRGTLYIDLDATPDRLFYVKGSVYGSTGWRRITTVAV